MRPTAIILSLICSFYINKIQSRKNKVLLFPSPFYSHTASVYAIGKQLLAQGFNVHMLQHWSFKIPDGWLEDGRLKVHRYGSMERGGYHVENFVANMTKEYLEQNHGFNFYLENMQHLSKYLAEDVLINNDQLFGELESLNFDIAVVDSVFFMRFSCLIPHRLHIPMVTYSDSINPWLVRMPWLPSIFSPMRMSTDTHNDFWKRLVNLFTIIAFKWFPHSLDLDQNILDKYRTYGNFYSLEDLISRSVLFFIPGDPVLDVVRPSTSNVVFVGGLTTDLIKTSSPKSIPPEYEQFLTDPQNKATILVSFGSMVYWYPESLAILLIKAFELLQDYRFIWKFPNDHEMEIPANVMVVKWMPQAELLTRKEIKLFVTHSGNNGQFESLYHGVPMLAMPLFTDQIRNAHRIVERKYGEQLDYGTATPELFAGLIEKIIEDPSYSTNIKKASQMFRDQPQSPSERAAFWVNYVIKYGGDHLRPTGNDLYFWQYLCLDILFFCIIVLFSFLFAVYIILRYNIEWMFEKKKARDDAYKKCK